MKPAFQKDGTVTAVNASALNDGAAAVLVCSESFMQSHGLTPLVRVVGQGWHAQAPEWFTVAPVGAVQRLLSAVNLDVKAIDLFELNEAFSVVGLACRDELGIPADKLNVNGGAVALGHPLGATGTRILTTLIHAMCGRAAKTGVAALCNGGGEATALMVERV